MNISPALLLAAAVAAAPAPRTPEDFAFDLFKKVASASPAKNVFLSPSSARWALSMAYAGSAGDTQKAMALALGAPPLAEDLALESNRIASLMSADPKVTLRVANSIWLKRGFLFKEAFTSSVTAAFRAEIFERDFMPADADEANAWVSGKTEGKIPTILDKFGPGDRALLLNAVYFKGSWTDQFKKERTRPDDFHLAGGAVVRRPLMERYGGYPYFEGEGFQALRLPYGGGRLGMIVLLPAPGRPLDSLIETTANAAGWRAVIGGLNEKQGLVRLPRFKLDFSASLGGPLAGLGMGVAFDRLRADFTGMAEATKPADRLFISRVLQKTFVEVNEEGTEAAAATAVVMASRGSARPAAPPFEFIADRPFLYAVEDNATGELLFLGALYEPPAKPAR
ncbi:MAG: serpin family protein [Elusimicrobia bacterium]|nr:serpin family protein [Elusimicrobiota bacterium]